MKYRAILLCVTTFCLQAAIPSFQKIGKGPGILLIHGFGGNKEVWTGVAAELARDHTVLSVDLPGSGGSPGPALVENRADFGVLAKELAMLARREGLAPCLVVGHSMGGPIAARTVLEDPTTFRGLVLVDSFLGALPAAYMEPTITALGKDPEPALAAFMGHVTTGPVQNQRVVSEALRIPATTLQAYLRALTVDSLASRQAQLRLPVLQLAAGPREPDRAKEAAALAMFGFKGLPSFRAVHFPTAKHWIMWDTPESFLLALLAFEAGLGH